MVTRTRRCSTCKGCTADYCGTCSFCKDSPRFGGFNIKKQTCVNRRCLVLLQSRLEVERQHYRKACGKCDSCFDSTKMDCASCLVCMDKLHFGNSFLPGAMCYQRKCDNAIYLPAKKDAQNLHASRAGLRKKLKFDNVEKSKKLNKLVGGKSQKLLASKKLMLQSLSSCAKKLKQRSVHKMHWQQSDAMIRKYKFTQVDQEQKKENNPTIAIDLTNEVTSIEPGCTPLLSNEQAFIESVFKPRTALEKAFVRILHTNSVPGPSEPSCSIDEEVMDQVSLKAVVDRETSPEILDLFNTLPIADFSSIHGQNFDSQFTDFKNCMEPISVVPVIVKNSHLDHNQECDLGLSREFLGYVVSLDKARLMELLFAENRRPTNDKVCGSWYPTNVDSNDPDKALQMKLLKMHSDHQLDQHTYALRKNI